MNLPIPLVLFIAFALFSIFTSIAALIKVIQEHRSWRPTCIGYRVSGKTPYRESFVKINPNPVSEITSNEILTLPYKAVVVLVVFCALPWFLLFLLVGDSHGYGNEIVQDAKEKFYEHGMFVWEGVYSWGVIIVLAQLLATLAS